jgi:Arc/MetJ-type ribon-helix-helix transcriptional regulator
MLWFSVTGCAVRPEETPMPDVQISDAVKDILDGLVANGVVGSGAEFVEQAVRLCAADHDYDEAELVAATEAGLADMRAGKYTTIDGPESRAAFWDQIRHEVRQKVAGSAVGT